MAENKPSETPQLTALALSKPGRWADWNDRDFHELENLAGQLERSNVALRLACEAIIYATDTGGAMDLIKNISIASQQARAAIARATPQKGN